MFQTTNQFQVMLWYQFTQGTHQWSSASSEAVLRAIGGLQLALGNVALAKHKVLEKCQVLNLTELGDLDFFRMCQSIHSCI
jgi:hypothetical protein